MWYKRGDAYEGYAPVLTLEPSTSYVILLQAKPGPSLHCRLDGRGAYQIRDVRAAQTAIAIRNAYLLRAEQEQRELSEALAKAAAVVNSLALVINELVANYATLSTV